MVHSCLQWNPASRPTAERLSFSLAALESRFAAAHWLAAPPLHQPSRGTKRPLSQSPSQSPAGATRRTSCQPASDTRCVEPGCTIHRLRKNVPFCWRHRLSFFPDCLVLAMQLQRERILQYMWSSDLLAVVARAAEALAWGLLPFAIIALLKTPLAIDRFLLVLSAQAGRARRGGRARASPKSIIAGLQAASAGCKSFLCSISHVFFVL